MVIVIDAPNRNREQMIAQTLEFLSRRERRALGPREQIAPRSIKPGFRKGKR